MGRVIRSEVIALRCELRSCENRVALAPVPVRKAWESEKLQLRQLVASGWAVVLTPQLRSYCPQHADRVWQCSCRTNPDRAHLCVLHSDEAAALVWAPQQELLKEAS